MANNSLKAALAFLFSCGLLVSCASTGDTSSSSTSQTKQTNKEHASFDYLVEGGQDWGLVQAFISDGRAHVQFLDIERVNPFFIDSKGNDLAFSRKGMFAVFESAPLEIYVASHFGKAKIFNKKIVALQKSAKPLVQSLLPEQSVLPDPELVHVATASEDAVFDVETAPVSQLESEIVKLQEQKNTLDAEIHGMTSALLLARSQLSEIQAVASLLASPESFLGESGHVVHRVYFDDFSTSVSGDVLDNLIAVNASKAAADITVRGFTDSFTSTETAVSLASSRSLNVKNYLVGKGIPASKISTRYKSYGNFLVENVGDNRRFNRRAEVIYHFPNVLVANSSLSQ